MFSRSNQGAGSSGTGSSNWADQEISSDSGSLAEAGAYAAGQFTFGAVSYAGSSSDSFSDSGAGAESWSGGTGGMGSGPPGGSDSGSDSFSAWDGGNGSFTMSAAGSYADGSFALSSYVLSGGSSGSYSNGSGWQQTLGWSSSSQAQSASGQESDGLYQAGASSGGAYANSSYSFTDSALVTTTQQAQGAGYFSSDTWVTAEAEQQLGSTATLTSGATFSYQDDWGSGTDASTSSGSPGGSSSGAAVAFAAPDGTTVPVGGAGSSGGAGSAPVSASASLSVVGTTSGWLSATAQLGWQAVGQGASRASAAAPAAQPAAAHGSPVARSAASPSAASSSSGSSSSAPSSQGAPKASGSGGGGLFDMNWEGDEYKGGFTTQGITALPIRPGAGDAALELDAMLDARTRLEAEGKLLPPLTAGDVPLYGLDGNQTAGVAMAQAGQLITKLARQELIPFMFTGVAPLAMGADVVFALSEGDYLGAGLDVVGIGLAGNWGWGRGGTGLKPPEYSYNPGKAAAAGKLGAEAAVGAEEAGTVFARARKAAGKVNIHHLVSRYLNAGRWRRNWTVLAQGILKRAKVGIESLANKVALIGHQGPHPELYHRRIYERLLKVAGTLRGAKLNAAVLKELEAIAQELINDVSKLSGVGL